MREILFKAKRKDNNEWIKGCLLILESGYYIVPKNTYYSEIDIMANCTVNAIWEEQDFFEVIPETISQYTGLNDKNGVKIFENDEVQAFCEFKETDVSGIVKFNLYNGLELEMFDGEVWHFDYLKDIEVIKSLFDEEVK